MDLTQYIANLAKKQPSQYLTGIEANNMYDTVPTPARDFVGLKKMTKVKYDDTVIKVTAYEPVFGTTKEVKAGATAPVSEKLGVKSEKFITAKFKDSYLFTEEELFLVARANRGDARDGEKRACAEMIIRHVQAIKLKDRITKEKLYWEGLMGTMNVQQIDDNKVTTHKIATSTRSLPNLTSTLKWDDHTVNSTARPDIDLRTLSRSFRGKGMKLDKVWMNQATYDKMILTSFILEYFKYTSNSLITKDKIEPLAGVQVEIYDEAYLDDNKVLQYFIPDGYIIGEGKLSDGGIAVELAETINVDATKEDTEGVDYVYGEYFRIKNTEDPVSKKIFLSDCALPVIKNGQIFVSQKVY